MRGALGLKAAALVFLAVTAMPAAAQAQAQPGNTRPNSELAIQKGNEGVQLYEQGRWDEALEHFREAESLYHSPVFILYTARALRNSGRLRDARDAFQKLVNERLEPPAPELWHQAQRDALAELSELEANIPADNVEEQSVVSKPTPPPPQAAPHPRPAPVATSRRTPEPKSVSEGVYLPGLVSAGVGGAALIAGGVVGIWALSDRSQLRDSLPAGCMQTTCPPSQRAKVEERSDKVRALGTAADVLFISGAALAAIGVGLMLIDPREVPGVTVRATAGHADVGFTF
jgi:tetratricopeptide (TPR) repeat protein